MSAPQLLHFVFHTAETVQNLLHCFFLDRAQALVTFIAKDINKTKLGQPTRAGKLAVLRGSLLSVWKDAVFLGRLLALRGVAVNLRYQRRLNVFLLLVEEALTQGHIGKICVFHFRSSALLFSFSLAKTSNFLDSTHEPGFSAVCSSSAKDLVVFSEPQTLNQILLQN